MKKSGMVALLGVAIIFIGISLSIQPSTNKKVSDQSLEFINNTKEEYKIFVENSHNIEEILNSFEGLFGMYLEEIPNVYQEYYDKLNLVKELISKLDEHVLALNELCNIPFDDKETTEICVNYGDNYQKIKQSYESVISTFNETITNYNKMAIYSEILEEKQLYK